jgi:hypothetical protein
MAEECPTIGNFSRRIVIYFPTAGSRSEFDRVWIVPARGTGIQILLQIAGYGTIDSVLAAGLAFGLIVAFVHSP